MFTVWQVFFVNFFIMFVTPMVFMIGSKESKLVIFISVILVSTFYSGLLISMLYFINWIWVK